MPQPIPMNLMRPNNLSSSHQYRLLNNNVNKNSVSFNFAQPIQGLQFRSNNMFNLGIISNVINSKPGCGSCGK